MKFIFNNMYFKFFSFNSLDKFSKFVDQKNVKKIRLDESFGDKYCCYIGYDSLTQDAMLAISFESDYEKEDLSIVNWMSQKLFVLYTGTHAYFIYEKITIRFFLEISTPLIGFYITKGDNLLILEEASARLINAKGEVLKCTLFDHVEDYSIKDNILFLIVDRKEKIFELV